jgi:hypothetical protein
MQGVMLCGWMSFSRNFETVPSKRKSLIYTFSTPRRPDCSTTPLLETEISHSVRRMKITVFKEAMLCHLADKYLRFEKGGGGLLPPSTAHNKCRNQKTVSVFQLKG